MKYLKEGHPTITRLYKMAYDNIKNKGLLPPDTYDPYQNSQLDAVSEDDHRSVPRTPINPHPEPARDQDNTGDSNDSATSPTPAFHQSLSSVPDSDVSMEEHFTPNSPLPETRVLTQQQPLRTQYGRQVYHPSGWEAPIPPLSRPTTPTWLIHMTKSWLLLRRLWLVLWT